MYTKLVLTESPKDLKTVSDKLVTVSYYQPPSKENHLPRSKWLVQSLRMHILDLQIHEGIVVARCLSKDILVMVLRSPCYDHDINLCKILKDLMKILPG